MGRERWGKLWAVCGPVLRFGWNRIGVPWTPGLYGGMRTGARSTLVIWGITTTTRSSVVPWRAAWSVCELVVAEDGDRLVQFYGRTLAEVIDFVRAVRDWNAEVVRVSDFQAQGLRRMIRLAPATDLPVTLPQLGHPLTRRLHLSPGRRIMTHPQLPTCLGPRLTRLPIAPSSGSSPGWK